MNNCTYRLLDREPPRMRFAELVLRGIAEALLLFVVMFPATWALWQWWTL